MESNTVKLKAEYNYSQDDLAFGGFDATRVDKFIKYNLALELAQKMVEEDLITIWTDNSLLYNGIARIKAEVTILQE